MEEFEIDLVCSDDGCGLEATIWVSDIADLDDAVCECGACLQALRVAGFVPLRPRSGAHLVLLPDTGSDAASAERPAIAA